MFTTIEAGSQQLTSDQNLVVVELTEARVDIVERFVGARTKDPVVKGGSFCPSHVIEYAVTRKLLVIVRV